MSGGDRLALLLGQSLGDVLDLGVGEEEGSADHVVTESLRCQLALELRKSFACTYGVSCNVDVLLLAVVNEILLDKERVALNLVSSWCDTSALDDCLKL